MVRELKPIYSGGSFVSRAPGRDRLFNSRVGGWCQLHMMDDEEVDSEVFLASTLDGSV